MKKIMLSMALLLSVGTVMGQVDKAALKAAQKEAKAQMAEAVKMDQALLAKINEKAASAEEILSECKKGQALVRKAIKSGAIAENKLGEAYKTLADFAQFPNNVMLNLSQNNHILLFQPEDPHIGSAGRNKEHQDHEGRNWQRELHQGQEGRSG